MEDLTGGKLKGFFCFFPSAFVFCPRVLCFWLKEIFSEKKLGSWEANSDSTISDHEVKPFKRLIFSNPEKFKGLAIS